MRGFHCSDGAVSVRPLERRDAPWLLKWLNHPEVLQYYEGRDCPQDLEAIYSRYIARQGNPVQSCLVLYHDQPIGYLQVYPVDPDDAHRWGFPTVHWAGMDLFIGETNLWDRGIGQALVHAASRALVNRYGVEGVVVDPRVDNPRAVHVYEKCGFKAIKRLPKEEMHEGSWRDCWLMLYEPSDR